MGFFQSIYALGMFGGPGVGRDNGAVFRMVGSLLCDDVDHSGYRVGRGCCAECTGVRDR